MAGSDAALLERWIVTRDADAFAEIVSRYSALVYSTCQRVMGNPNDAEDVAQECFIELVRVRKTIRPSLGGWLHMVATRRSLDRIKAETRRKRREVRFAEKVDMSAETTWDDMKTHIDEAIAALPEKLREPIIYRFLKGQTQNAIARNLGISSSTVQYRLSKGIEEMRKFLKKRGVVAPSVVLTFLLGAHLTAEAAPATLTAALGKLTLAGATGAVGGTVGASGTGITALGGVLFMKKAIIGIAVVLAGGIGIWAVKHKQQPEPIKPAPKTLVAEPAEQLLRVAVQDQPAVPESAPEQAAVYQPSDPVISEGGSISGRVTALDTGEPVSGAKMTVLSEGDYFIGDNEPQSTSTSDGTYVCHGVEPGVYEVECMPPEGFVYSRDDRLTVIVPHEGNAIRADFRLGRATSISGRVMNTGQRGIEGAQLSASLEGSGRARDYTETDRNGNYRLARIKPNSRYRISAEANGYGPARSSPILVPGKGEVSGVDPVLELGATIAGRVIDIDGEGVPNAMIRLSQARRSSGWRFARAGPEGGFEVVDLQPGEYRFWTDEEDLGLGAFRPSMTPPVTVGAGESLTGVEVVVCPKTGGVIEGYVRDETGKAIPDVLVNARDWRNLGVSTETDLSGHYRVEGLDQDGPATMIDFLHRAYGIVRINDVPVGTMDADVVMVRRNGSVAGVVTDAASREPITHFKVSAAFLKDDGSSGGATLPRGFYSKTGEFLLEKLRPGTATLIALAPGYAPQEVSDVAVKGGQVTSGIEFRLLPGSTISGAVVSAADSHPVAGAEVCVSSATAVEYGEGFGTKAITAQDGSFELKDVGSGEQTIHVKHPDFVPTAVTVKVPEGKDARVVIRLGLGGMIAGYVTAASEPSVGARIQLTDPEGTIRFTETDDDGYYEFADLLTGTYELLVTNRQTCPGFQDATVDVLEGHITEQNFEF